MEHMFLTDCPACGLRELRGPRSIELLVNTDRGPTWSTAATRAARSTPSAGKPAVDAKLEEPGAPGRVPVA